MQAIYVPADDLTDPAPATTFAHLDATTVLSRGEFRRIFTSCVVQGRVSPVICSLDCPWRIRSDSFFYVLQLWRSHVIIPFSIL